MVGLFLKGLGKTYFSCKNFLFSWLSCVPFCLFVFVLAPSGILTCIKAKCHHIPALFHMLMVCMHSKCLIKCPNGIFSLFWTSMSINFWGLSWLCMFIMYWSLVVRFTHFALWVLAHLLVIHLTCTLDAPLLHTL